MTPKPAVHKHFSTSILLWVRADQPRQTSMAYWKGPHSGIIAATPGLHGYHEFDGTSLRSRVRSDQS